ncbi:MAG TPA: hypothetical protein VG816_08060 [Solirubrobacterales bacterium]|nr:hypothetical protein [Solirubrobacterales bacterium]
MAPMSESASGGQMTLNRFVSGRLYISYAKEYKKGSRSTRRPASTGPR